MRYFLSVLLILAGMGGALAEKRVALIIGNDDYISLPDLNNARKDATDMARTLKRLGFEVILKVNAGRREMTRAKRAFESKLSSSQVGLVFYAGHGIQADGSNFLIPTDARIEFEDDLEAEGIEARDFLDAMERAGAPMNIVILDACRDNPLPKRTRSAARGLAVVGIPQGAKGTAILYSAGEGQVAQDGSPGGNGVFTGELLNVLDRPGLTLEQVFKRVARGVGDRTHGKQRPWSLTSLQGDFYFTGGAQTASPSAAQSGGTDKETVFWQSIQNSTDPADYEAYLSQYPNGAFAPLARARATKYRTPQVASLPPAPSFQVTPVDEEMAAVKTANVRAEPSTTSSKIGKLAVGIKVDVTGKTRVGGSTWYRIALANRDIGYVFGSLLTKEEIKPPFSAKPAVTPMMRLAREAAAVAREAARAAREFAPEAREAARLAREAAAMARRNPGDGYKVFTTSSAGDHYEGEYRDGKRNGRGVNTWANGNRYEGEFRDNRRNGRGMMIFADGRHFEAEYRDDKRNGHVVQTWASGQRYEGEYRGGKRNGHGVITYANGGHYEGEWRDGETNGRGVRTWSIGHRYEGEERDGKKDGRGVFTYADGRVEDGTFKDDKFVRR
jgi:uncharacterized caspase-like protein